MDRRSDIRKSDDAFRHHWISEAAYYKAESRHFAAGLELDDWLLAERQFVIMQVKRYLAIAEEDGGMTRAGLQRLAKSVGIESLECMLTEEDLVHGIQQRLGDESCFNLLRSDKFCSAKQSCLWKLECKQMSTQYGLKFQLGCLDKPDS